MKADREASTVTRSTIFGGAALHRGHFAIVSFIEAGYVSASPGRTVCSKDQ
jgi:hypothetical protein